MKQPKPITLSVVLPCWNEGPRIAAHIANTDECLRELCGDAYEIVAVDDGSTDDTWNVLLQTRTNIPHLRLLRQPENKGKGNAVKRGVLAAEGKYVAYLDADGEISPTHLSYYLQQAQRGADIVVASKAHKRSQLKRSTMRKMLSWGFCLVNKMLFGLSIRDTQVGLKLMKTRLAHELFPMIRSHGFCFDVELLALCAVSGAKIEEAPVTIQQLPNTTSIGITTVVTMLRDMFQLAIRLFQERRTHKALFQKEA